MQKKYSRPLCLLVFCVGALSQFDVNLIARVPLGEVLAFSSIPILLFHGNYFQQIAHRLNPVLLVLGIWVLGIVLSDVLNQFIFPHFIRAFMKPLFCFLWMLFFIGVLMRDYRVIIFYPFGTVLAALQNYVAPRAFNAEYLQAGGYEAVAYGVVPILGSVCLSLAVLLYAKGRLYAMFAFIFSAVILIIVGAPRSSAAITLINAGIVFYVWWTRPEKGRIYRLTLGRFILFFCMACVAMLSIYYAYVFAAGAGWLGELQYQKLVSQQNTILGTNPLGLILGGRTYVFAAILAIMDQPLIGFGSWTGIFMSDYYYEAVSIVGTDARDLQMLTLSGNVGMAGHSVLFQGWLENGILAAIALCVIAYWVLREFILLLQHDNRLTPWVVALTTAFFWGFFFSPFGVGSRVTIGLFLAFHALKFHDFELRFQKLNDPEHRLLGKYHYQVT